MLEEKIAFAQKGGLGIWSLGGARISAAEHKRRVARNGFVGVAPGGGDVDDIMERRTLLRNQLAPAVTGLEAVA